MKKYRVSIITSFGTLQVDDIEAENEWIAFENACEKAMSELSNFAKLGDWYEYDPE